MTPTAHFRTLLCTITLLAAAICTHAQQPAQAGTPPLSKVYMYKKITPENLVKIYEALGRPARGRVAVKLSTGEPGNNNYLAPSLIQDLVHKVNGTIIECNTAYGGGRADTRNQQEVWSDLPPQDHFLESMAEAAKAITDHCGDNILYISVANNLSVDCDCVAAPEDPKMGDIGILASLDPVALDRACVDQVHASKDHGKVHLIERIDSRNGMHTLDYAEQLGIGSQKYQLIPLD